MKNKCQLCEGGIDKLCWCCKIAIPIILKAKKSKWTIKNNNRIYEE